jgi:hypothetical protein
MSQEAVERVLGRLLSDDGFRLKAAQGLAELCRAEGYALTEGELLALGRTELAPLEAAAARIDPSIKRFSRRLPAGGEEAGGLPHERSRLT